MLSCLAVHFKLGILPIFGSLGVLQDYMDPMVTTRGFFGNLIHLFDVRDVVEDVSCTIDIQVSLQWADVYIYLSFDRLLFGDCAGHFLFNWWRI